MRLLDITSHYDRVPCTHYDLPGLKGWVTGMVLSRKILRCTLGVLWLIDGLLQMQPRMFTLNMINGVMSPVMQGQPGPIATNLSLIVAFTTQHLLIINLLIGLIQAEIGIFLIAGIWVRGTVIVSIVWALIVWYAGEGMSMLLTGQASLLSGAPGAVLLYPLLGLLVYPRKGQSTNGATGDEGSTLLSQTQFRLVLAGFWIFAALLQLQPYWWQKGQFSQAVTSMIGQGGLDSLLIDPLLHNIAVWTAPLELPLNIGLIVAFLALGIALAVLNGKWLRPLLVLSIVFSLVIWWITQAFGMLLTGMATDFNTGLLLVLMTLACWPKASRPSAAQKPQVYKVKEHDLKGPESSAGLASTSS